MFIARNFKGTHDLYGKDYLLREEIRSIIEANFLNYGFQPLDTPAIEYLDVLFSKYSGDQEKLVFPLAYKNGKIAGLRYDLTIPLARFVVQNEEKLVFPLRSYQIAKVWRADSPQFGRYREFYQCDADYIAYDIGLLEVAEILFMIYSILNQLQLADFVIKLNHRSFLEIFMILFTYKRDKKYFFQILDKKEKMDPHDFKKNFESTLEISFDFFFKILNVLELYLNQFLESSKISKESLFLFLEKFLEEISLIKEFKNVYEIVKKKLSLLFEDFYNLIYYLYCFSGNAYTWQAIQKKLSISLNLARGMDYYSSWIYEASFEEEKLSILGGGVYDHLIASFQKKSEERTLKGIGLSFGLDRILGIYKSKIKKESPLFKVYKKIEHPISVLILRFADEDIHYSLNFLNLLRENSIHSKIYESPQKKLKKQIQDAIKQRILILCFIGKNEVENQQIRIRMLSYKNKHDCDNASDDFSNPQNSEYLLSQEEAILKIKDLIKAYFE